jgi:hypothetical protein
MTKCHLTLPIVESDFATARRKSPFLFTTMLAIAGMYYVASQQRDSSLPFVEPSAITAIKQLAYSHFGASMFRKRPRALDVQAVLLLSNWNLFGRGMSPDTWLVSGHCGRLAYRIGLDRVADIGSHIPPSDGEAFLSQSLPILERWRTWLGWNMYVRYAVLRLTFVDMRAL